MRWRSVSVKRLLIPVLGLAWYLASSSIGLADGSGQREVEARTGGEEMVLIPAGPFLMGSNPNAGLGFLVTGVDETPQQEVHLPAFWIDRFEVTIDQYRVFVAETGHRPPPIWGDDRYPAVTGRHPVIDVSWYDAEAYCRWAGKRLPTEAEWEKAARGPDGRIWPWGDEFLRQNTNTEEHGAGWTVPVGSVPADVSPYGVYDMAGNAMEWTASWYQPYPGSRLERAAFGEKYRVMKGGAWSTPALPFSRAANRHAVAPRWDHPSHGFRCAEDSK